MILASDRAMMPIVQDKMKGTMLLSDNETEEGIISEYFKHKEHFNYIIDYDINGFLCLSVHDDVVTISFAWHIGTFTTQKKMVRLGKELYKMYTLDQGKPIYYTGLKNFYPNHSIEIAEDVWEFIA
jgi:hypothetical protein